MTAADDGIPVTVQLGFQPTTVTVSATQAARALRDAGWIVRAADDSSAREVLIAKLVAAWTNPGRAPAYHAYMVRRLWYRWPLLARSIAELAEHERTRRD